MYAMWNNPKWNGAWNWSQNYESQWTRDVAATPQVTSQRSRKYLTLFALGGGHNVPSAISISNKTAKKFFLSLLFVWQFLKFIREHEKNKFSKFGPLTWPPMTSSNLGPFFHGQTLINWKCFNFSKNQYFWTKFGHKMHF